MFMGEACRCSLVLYSRCVDPSCTGAACNRARCSLHIWTLGKKPMEVRGNNRSVMPLDVLGGTRVTMVDTKSKNFALLDRAGKSLKVYRDWD